MSDAEGADLPSSILGAKRCEPRHGKSYLGQSVCSTARDPMIGVGQASVTTVDRRYARLHECPLHISRSPFDLPLSPFTWPPTITTTSFGSREDLNCVPVTYRTRGSHAKAPPSPTCTSTKSTRSSRRPGAWPGAGHHVGMPLQRPPLARRENLPEGGPSHRSPSRHLSNTPDCDTRPPVQKDPRIQTSRAHLLISLSHDTLTMPISSWPGHQPQTASLE